MMAGRPRGTYCLSEWEIEECAYCRRCGWTNPQLADYYGVSTRTVERIFQRRREATRANPSHANGENE